MDKGKLIKILKLLLVIVVIAGMLYAGIIFTFNNKTKLDKTKPVFFAEENIEKVKGKVTSLLKNDDGTIDILVENSDENSIIDKVNLTLNLETTTVVKGNNGLLKITDVEIGQNVEASFDKAKIKEYPIQATAKKISIID